jgi:predicted phage-related endonuclease
MSTIINLVQGSAEWHEHRRLLRNASESAAVMGISPWVTPYQLSVLSQRPQASCW